MSGLKYFRYKSQELLTELDLATIQMMSLVAAREVSGLFWEKASERHRKAYAAWNEFLNNPIKSME